MIKFIVNIAFVLTVTFSLTSCYYVGVGYTYPSYHYTPTIPVYTTSVITHSNYTGYRIPERRCRVERYSSYEAYASAQRERVYWMYNSEYSPDGK